MKIRTNDGMAQRIWIDGSSDKMRRMVTIILIYQRRRILEYLILYDKDLSDCGMIIQNSELQLIQYEMFYAHNTPYIVIHVLHCLIVKWLSYDIFYIKHRLKTTFFF